MLRVAQLEHERGAADQTSRDLLDLAYRDPLTSLPNRRAWDQALAGPFADASQRVLAIFDVDTFKQLNDTCGHTAGDRVLCAVADGLERSLRETDFVARLGGDEFAVLLTGLPTAHAEAVVERIRGSACLPASEDGQLPEITVSAGVAVAAADEDSWAELFERADTALAAAKRAGRNRTVQG